MRKFLASSSSFETACSLRFELDERHVFGGEALVADPLCVNFLRQKVERRLRQTGAHAVKPEIAARFAENRLKNKK
jgi:hypothetical protein